jgi:hypothetical protein
MLERQMLSACAMTVVLFALGFLEIGSHFLPTSAWTAILLFKILAITGTTGVRHPAQLFSIEICRGCFVLATLIKVLASLRMVPHIGLSKHFA